MKKPWKVVASLGLAVSILATSNLNAQASAPIGEVKVTAGSLYARSDDSFTSKIVKVLKKGETYAVYGQSNGMYDLGGGTWTSANGKYVAYTDKSGTSASSNVAVSGTVTIKVSALNVRSQADFSSKVVKVVKKGESFKVYGEKNGLYNIGGNQWVSASTNYVTYSGNGTVASETKQGTVLITASQLNVRQKADFNSKIMGTVQKGQSYTIYEERNGLYRIGTDKWISASPKYVSVGGQAPVTMTASAPAVSVSQTQKLIDYGKQYMGMRYVWASSDPQNGGFDCSGFIYHVYKNNGYNIKRLNVEGYWNTVKKISSPQVGDLVFFKDTYRKGPSHIGIYLGDGKFLNANSSKGVAIDSMSNSYWKNHFLGYGTFR